VAGGSYGFLEVQAGRPICHHSARTFRLLAALGVQNARCPSKHHQALRSEQPLSSPGPRGQDLHASAAAGCRPRGPKARKMASTPCKRSVGGSAHRRSPCAGKLAHQRTRLAVAERLAEVGGERRQSQIPALNILNYSIAARARTGPGEEAGGRHRGQAALPGAAGSAAGRGCAARPAAALMQPMVRACAPGRPSRPARAQRSAAARRCSGTPPSSGGSTARCARRRRRRRSWPSACGRSWYGPGRRGPIARPLSLGCESAT